MTATTNITTDPAALVAIIVAARRSGDRSLERTARRELYSQFNVKLSFAKDGPFTFQKEQGRG